MDAGNSGAQSIREQLDTWIRTGQMTKKDLRILDRAGSRAPFAVRPAPSSPIGRSDSLKSRLAGAAPLFSINRVNILSLVALLSFLC
jgi:hypothetical protein